jgi:hypothetical protein
MTTTTEGKNTRILSTREEKAQAIAIIKKAIKEGAKVNDSQVFRQTGVSRAVFKLKQAKIIGEKHGKMQWLTDWSTTEIIELCWANHAKESRTEKPATTGATLIQSAIPLPEPDPQHTITTCQDEHKFRGEVANGLEIKIDSALKLCEAYKIDNRAKFIADYLTGAV